MVEVEIDDGESRSFNVCIITNCIFWALSLGSSAVLPA